MSIVRLTTAKLQVQAESNLEIQVEPTEGHFLRATLPALVFLIMVFALSFFVRSHAKLLALIVIVPFVILEWREFCFLRKGGDSLEIKDGQLRFERIEPSRSLVRIWPSLFQT